MTPTNLTIAFGAIWFWIASANPPAAQAALYENDEFGFRVSVPDKTTTCRASPPEHDHGIAIFLDNGKGTCDALRDKPFIALNATYNTTFDPTPAAVLHEICEQFPGKLEAPPPEIKFGKSASNVCQLDRADGWIDIHVVSQGGSWPQGAVEGNASIPYINYIALLHTRSQRLHRDLQRFAGVLNTFHLGR